MHDESIKERVVVISSLRYCLGMGESICLKFAFQRNFIQFDLVSHLNCC